MKCLRFFRNINLDHLIELDFTLIIDHSNFECRWTSLWENKSQFVVKIEPFVRDKA